MEGSNYLYTKIEIVPSTDNNTTATCRLQSVLSIHQVLFTLWLDPIIPKKGERKLNEDNMLDE